MREGEGVYPRTEWKTKAKVENFVKDKIKKFPQAQLLAKRPCQLYSFIWINSILLSQTSFPSRLPFGEFVSLVPGYPRVLVVGVPLIIYDSNSVISQLVAKGGSKGRVLERSFIIPVITQKYTFVVSPISCVTPRVSSPLLGPSHLFWSLLAFRPTAFRLPGAWFSLFFFQEYNNKRGWHGGLHFFAAITAELSPSRTVPRMPAPFRLSMEIKQKFFVLRCLPGNNIILLFFCLTFQACQTETADKGQPLFGQSARTLFIVGFSPARPCAALN